MFKVLVVEDDPQKLSRIVNVLKGTGILDSDLETVTSSQQAKTWLRLQHCDLMILDLNLPRRVDGAPIKGEGSELLKDISIRPRYHKPTHVLGLTEYEDEYKRAAPIFEEALVSILMYDRTDDIWERRLERKVEYLIATKIAKPPHGDFDCDFAITTALDRPELEAVLQLPWQWEATNVEDDDTPYYLGKISTSDREYKIVASATAFMGMSAAAALAMKVINKFRPRYLIHCGILAGIQGRADFGDVLVADPSWDWGSGKFTVKEGNIVFYAAPYQILLREELRGKIRRMAVDHTSLAQIYNGWLGPKPSTVLKLILGPVASGAAVLSDGNTALKIEEQHRKLIGIEMETYGVLAAAEFCSRPRPLAISMKAVSDFAGPNKNDNYQPYAAYTSARCMQLLIEKYLLPTNSQIAPAV